MIIKAIDGVKSGFNSFTNRQVIPSERVAILNRISRLNHSAVELLIVTLSTDHLKLNA